MADGKFCKTCGWQESEHEMLIQNLNGGTRAWTTVPPEARNWSKKDLHDFFINNDISEGRIEDFYYDVARCPGFSTTRKPRKHWVSFAEA